MMFDVAGEYYARQRRLDEWTKSCKEKMSNVNIGDPVSFYSPMQKEDCSGTVTEKSNFYTLMVVNQDSGRKWSVPIDCVLR